MKIHPTAIVDSTAEIRADVEIGPYCILGPQVRIGQGCVLESHVHIQRWTTIGEACRFYSFGSIGSDPQDLKYQGEVSHLHIGRGNVFREFVTVNRGTEGGGGLTAVWGYNLFMGYSHGGPGPRLGNDVIFSHAAALPGPRLVQGPSTHRAFSAGPPVFAG